ncbi:MAG: ribonuclease P protein component [Chitinophagales bacterium]
MQGAAGKDVKNYLFLTNGPSNDITNFDKGSEKVIAFSGASFSKAERLRSKKIIASLFEAGQSFLSKPLRVLHQKIEHTPGVPIQVAMTAPKKIFPRAVDRNHLKRLMRETFRRNKNDLYTHLHNQNLSIAVIIIYSDASITTFNDMEHKMKLVLNRLMQVYDMGG